MVSYRKGCFLHAGYTDLGSSPGLAIYPIAGHRITLQRRLQLHYEQRLELFRQQKVTVEL